MGEWLGRWVGGHVLRQCILFLMMPVLGCFAGVPNVFQESARYWPGACWLACVSCFQFFFLSFVFVPGGDGNPCCSTRRVVAPSSFAGSDAVMEASMRRSAIEYVCADAFCFCSVPQLPIRSGRATMSRKALDSDVRFPLRVG